MIGRTNVGSGGGGLSPNSAVIHVSAPAGSTITFSKNNVIVKVLDASKSHVNSADAGLADWYYAVSSSNYGTWTIMATKTGKGSTSEEVNVSENRQYDVELSYNFWLIKDGKVKVSFTKTGGTITDGPFCVLFDTGGNSARIAYIQTDISSYLTMNIVVTGRSWPTSSDKAAPCIGTAQSVPSIGSDSATVTGSELLKKFSYNSSYITSDFYSIDISEITGTRYLFMAVSGASGYNGQLYISDFYLGK